MLFQKKLNRTTTALALIEVESFLKGYSIFSWVERATSSDSYRNPFHPKKKREDQRNLKQKARLAPKKSRYKLNYNDLI